MNGWSGTLLAVGAFAAAMATGVAVAQTVEPMPRTPVLPLAVYPEIGMPRVMVQGGGTGQPSGGSGGVSGGTGTGASAGGLSAQVQQTAEQAAASQGFSSVAMMDFCQTESGCQNIPNAGGTTSATGPWQMTQATFDQYAEAMGYSPSDITNPQIQAQVAAVAMSSYAQSVENYTGSPPTIGQACAAWEFGPGVGDKLAGSVNPDEPLSDVVPATDISNNNLQGYTVGQYFQMVNQRMGGSGGQAFFV